MSDEERPQTSAAEAKSPNSAGDARPPTFAETWAKAYPTPPRIGRLVLALLSFLGFAVFVWVVSTAVDAIPPIDIGISKHDFGIKDDPMVAVADMEQARRIRKAEMWAPQMPDVEVNTNQKNSVTPAAAAPSQGRISRRKTSSVVKSNPTTTAGNSVNPRYAAIWGTGESIAAMAAQPSSLTPNVPKKPAGGVRAGEGTLLYASLESTAASFPAEGRVIARLTKTHRLAGIVLKIGSKVHGRVVTSSNDDTRILVDFDFAVDVSGNRTDFNGSAQDLDGRPGIPAEKLLSGASGSSVLLAGISKGASVAGGTFGGGLGSVAGGTVGGAIEKATEKGQRLDRDEYVVIAKKGTALRIYVNSLGTS